MPAMCWCALHAQRVYGLSLSKMMGAASISTANCRSPSSTRPGRGRSLLKSVFGCSKGNSSSNPHRERDRASLSPPRSTNTAKGKIKIVKKTVGGDGTFGYTATGPYSFSQSPSITTSSGNGTTTPTYTVIGNSGSYSVTESANANFTLTSVSCSDGVNTLSNTSFTVPAGKTVTCTFTNTNKTRALFTDTLLCTFDVDSGSLGTQFHLIYTPDNTNHSVWRLNASTPGQYYYNIFNLGSGGSSLSVTLPYPWVTQGAVPIHVYSSVSLASVNGQTCLVPGTELMNFTTPVIN